MGTKKVTVKKAPMHGLSETFGTINKDKSYNPDVGDTVIILGWGKKLDGKKLTVLAVKSGRSESGTLIKVPIINDFIDKNWVWKYIKNNKQVELL